MAKPTDPEEEVKCVPDYESMVRIQVLSRVLLSDNIVLQV